MNFISWLKSLFTKKKDAAELDLSAIKKTEVPKPAPDVAVAPVPASAMPTQAEIATRLLLKAKEYVGVREHGYNKGSEVELFQRFVDGKAQGESWCMAFVQFIVGEVCKSYGIHTPLYPSEHCNTVYANTPEKYRLSQWTRGAAFIMRNPSDNSGHTGICDNDSMAVEGNTSVAGSTDGDGCYYRYRSSKGSLLKPMRGYINLPLMIQDAIAAQKKAAA